MRLSLLPQHLGFDLGEFVIRQVAGLVQLHGGLQLGEVGTLWGAALEGSVRKIPAHRQADGPQRDKQSRHDPDEG